MIYKREIKKSYKEKTIIISLRLKSVNLIFTILLNIGFSFISTSLNAQVKLSGFVLKNDKTNCDLATVKLLQDTLLINTTTTDIQGKYEFNNIKEGKYKIEISFVGFKTKDTLLILNRDVILESVLEIDKTLMKEVTIVGKRPLLERKIDRLVFNVENNINTVGLNTVDLIAKAPLIQVKNDDIAIIGREAVRIMLNGRVLNIPNESVKEYLKNIPVENISKIEIITNPSSNIDAEGAGGFVNIVTKSNKTLGFVGTINSSLIFATSNTARVGVNLNYNLKNTQFFTNLNLGYGSQISNYTNVTKYPNYIWDEKSQGKELSRVFSGSFGFEKDINKKLKIGSTYNLLYSKPDQYVDAETQILNNLQALDSIINMPNDFLITSKRQDFNFHLKYEIDSVKELLFDIDWQKNTFDRNNNIRSKTYLNSGILSAFGNINDYAKSFQNAMVISGNLEYKFSVKKSKFSIGTKGSFFSNENTLNYFNDNLLNTDKTDKFHVNQNIEAFFFDFNKAYKKFEVKIGLRGEFTNISTKSFSYNTIQNSNYFNLFPTLYLTYNLNDKNDFSFSYGKRLSRPSFSSLNPFKTYHSVYDYSIGNPNLKPYYTNNFEIDHTYNNILNNTIMISYCNEKYLYLNVYDTNSNIIKTNLDNKMSNFSFVYDLSVIYNKLRWFNSSNEASIYYSKIKTNAKEINSIYDGWSASFKSINTIYFNKKKTISTELDFSYDLPSNSGYYKNKSNFYSDFSFRYIYSKKIQVNLGLRDVFKTKYIKSTIIVNNIENYSTVNNMSRRFSINLRYSFGNNKIKKATSHSALGSDSGILN